MAHVESGARKRMKMAEDEEKEESYERNSFSDLPPEIITNILVYLSYDEIAECRMVCLSFNECGKNLLNQEARGILKDIRTHLNQANSNLPRTTSQWLNYKTGPKSRKHECLENIYNDIRFLYDSYKPYIEDNSSCFVAGKILDLANAVLSLDERRYEPPNYELVVVGLVNYEPPNFQLTDLYGVLTRLKHKALTHFISVIIPMIRKRKILPTYGKTQALYRDSQLHSWLPPVQPALSSTSERSGSPNTDWDLPDVTYSAKEVGLQWNNPEHLQTYVQTKDQTIASLQKSLVESQRQTIEAQKLIIDLLKAK